ncbi:hypothetical protein [Bacillus thuringiensis]|uniref:hypothetical protein n=1 Tax=Bacillus thuringiensis TaxID=1428 RepID=UPI000BA1F3A6|nr:hypothetical protein [Bacillus thuringiensis]
MRNVALMRSVLREKLAINEELTPEDLATATEIAQRTQHMDDKLLYTQIKREYTAQKIKKQTAE